MPNYQIKRDGDYLESVIDADIGMDVPFDPSSKEYCRFIEWVRSQPHNTARSFGPSPDSCKFYCTLEEVLSHCKDKSTLLVAFGKDRHAYTDSITFVHATNASVRGSKTGTRDIVFHGLSTITSNPSRGSANNGLNILQTTTPSLYISESLHELLVRELSREGSEIQCASTQVVDRSFVYLDVSDFSQHTAPEQLAIITFLTRLGTNWPGNNESSSFFSAFESSICIGDGYIYVFREAKDAAMCAACMASLIERMIADGALIDFHFRIGVHTGEVYRFWDGSRWNYVGKGVTGGSRVLNAAGKEKDDVVYLSGETRKRIAATPHLEQIFVATPWLRNIGRHKDKHGEMWRLYEVDHAGWTKDFIRSKSDS